MSVSRSVFIFFKKFFLGVTENMPVRIEDF